MTSRKELESMVLQFKVSDLQLLLSFAGQNKNGRKTELQKRALHLINHKMSMPLGMKIRNIFREMVDESQKQNADYFYPSYNKYGNYYVNNGYSSQSTPSIPYDGYSSRNNYFTEGSHSYYDACVRKNNHYPTNCNNSTSFQEPPQASKFNFMSHLETGTKVPDSQKLSGIYFKKLTFFNYKSEIVSVVPLIPQNKRTDLFEFTYSFSLSQQTHSLLSWSKRSEKESRYQLQLRMCLLDDSVLNTSSEVSDSLPLALGVKVNDKNCQLPPAIPSTNKQGMLLKRMNAPINLTPQTSKKNHMNTLVINWSVECDKLYGIAIHLVEKYTSDELITRLREKGERDPEVTKKYVVEKLTDDDDIAATSLKVSLICPLGKILMSLPVRATTCNHLQCFDGTLYIKMNEVKSVWQCPVCNHSCYFEDLFIDGFFANVLRSGVYSSTVTDIQINSDGSSEPVLPEKRKSSESESSACKKLKPNSDELSVPVPEIVNEPKVPISPCKTEADHQITDDVANKMDERIPTALPRSAISVIVNNSSSSTTDAPLLVQSSSDEIKTNVVLVDLTSDTEPEDEDDCVPLNLKKHTESKEDVSIFEVDDENLPPVYDIDDSDELS